MKKLLIPTVLIICLLFLGCEKDSPEDISMSAPEEAELALKSDAMDVFPSETGSLSGSISFAGSAIPIPDVVITVCENCVVSSPDGSFRFDNIPAGIHSLVASREDYEEITREVIVSQEDDTRLVVYMTSKEHSTTVSGKLTGDDTGKPMSRLDITVLNPDGSESQLTAETGFDGYFQLPPVPHGDRQVVVKINNEVIYNGEVSLKGLEYELNLEVPESFYFRDDRDGKRYKAIRIGNQTWMAENLAFWDNPEASSMPPDPVADIEYDVPSDEGFNQDDAGALKETKSYGLLYPWNQAQNACPSGWHLPTDGEWKELEMNLGMSTDEADQLGRRESALEGLKVKSVQDWYEEGNGDNQSGFDILPAGMNDGYGKDIRKGRYAYFWTATPSNSTNAWFREVSYSKNGINRLYYRKKAGFSVRCLKD